MSDSQEDGEGEDYDFEQANEASWSRANRVPLIVVTALAALIGVLLIDGQHVWLRWIGAAILVLDIIWAFVLGRLVRRGW